MANTFAVGDIVQLKSGGPKMTVMRVGPKVPRASPVVFCAWFDGTKKFEGDFPPDALEIATPGQISSAIPDSI